MAWSFRFAALNKNKMTQIMVTPQHPHLDIGAWLELLDLRQYHGESTLNSIVISKSAKVNEIFRIFRKLLKVHRRRGADLLLRSGYQTAGGSKLGSSCTDCVELGCVAWQTRTWYVFVCEIWSVSCCQQFHPLRGKQRLILLLYYFIINLSHYCDAIISVKLWTMNMHWH